jgi:DNA recombination protein RmuC
MSAISLLFGLLLGIVVGAAIGFLYARGRLAAATADASARARAAEQRAALVDGHLAERFEALSAQALDASTARFLEVAEGRLQAANANAAGELETRRAAVEHLIGPLTQTLARLEEQLRESDAARRSSHAALAEQVHIARQTSEQLRVQTQALVTALRRPEARGRWGELQLRRVVELAGMSTRCDFDEQVTAGDGTLRPDMVVRLAGGKNIVVDSKVSLAAYLEAAESEDEDVRTARMDAHARHLRDHVDRLAGKAYWAALSPSPEFVILFIPGEAFLAPALERDPGLLEYALGRKVHIATPTTLVTMLRTAQYAWQQAALTDNARAVFDLGRELYDRIGSLGRHVDRLGRALTTAVSTYNQTVGSLESRVLVTARRLNELGVVDSELDPLLPVAETTRALSAPELMASGPPEIGPEIAPAETTEAARPVGLVRAAR